MTASNRAAPSSAVTIQSMLQGETSFLDEASAFIQEQFDAVRSLMSSIFNKGQHEKQQLLFKQLFDLIQKNTAIPKFLASIPGDREKIKKTQILLKAIQAGDSGAEIFREENCYMYLLYLMQHNKIDFWHGLTVYFYLMTFMESGLDRANHRVSVKDISKLPWCLTELCEHLPRPPNNRDTESELTVKLADELNQFVLTLPPSERWLLKIQFYDNDRTRDGFDDASRTAHAGQTSMPFLAYRFPNWRKNKSSGERELSPSAIYIPSFSVIKYLLQKVSAEPVELAPGFGRLGTKRLFSMHKNNKHPLPICAPAVKSNLTTIDSFPRVTGTIATAIHDLGHLFWMSSLKREFRESVYATYIPFLDRLKKEFEKKVLSGDVDTIETIEGIQERLNDFDLYNVRMRASNPDDRAHRYLNVAFLLANRKLGNEGNYNPLDRKADLIGTDTGYDNFYFFIEALRHSQFDMTSDEKDFLEKAATFVKDILDQSLKRLVFNGRISAALSKVAENHAKGNQELKQPSNPGQIQWDKWLAILTTKTDSTEIFNELVKHHHDELLTLMTECGLVFYPPFAPLTDEKRAQLIGFVREQMDLGMTVPRAGLC